MNVNEVKAIIEACKDTDYSYIKIKDKDVVIELGTREQPVMVQTAPIHNVVSQPVMQTPVVETVAESTISQGAKPDVKDDPNIHVITSPIVGTFYSASSPDADAFVQVGDVVKANQTVCIIEAMKLMNEIEAEVSGEVVEILVNNEDPIEFGQPLFAIRKR